MPSASPLTPSCESRPTNHHSYLPPWLPDERRQLVLDRSVGFLEAEDVPFVFDDRLRQHRAAVGPQVVARALARNPEVVAAERERLLGDVGFAGGRVVLVVLVVEYRFEIVGASGCQGAERREPSPRIIVFFMFRFFIFPGRRGGPADRRPSGILHSVISGSCCDVRSVRTATTPKLRAK